MRVDVLVFRPSGCRPPLELEILQKSTPEDWQAIDVSSSRSLLRRLRQAAVQPVVILPYDSGDGEASGLTLLRQIRRTTPEVPVIVAAQAGDVDSAARAVAAGANDFLVWTGDLPQRIRTLLGKLQVLLEALERGRRLDEQNVQLCESLQQRAAIVGQSEAVRHMLDQIQAVAKVPRPVLIVGERGTGKELVARAIHLAGGPAHRPMVTVNCAAFSETLLESELFGHERGAFTGADTQRRGKFEQADGGTLFLDEVGNMPLAFQEKILRVVEYGTFHRIGGTEELRSTARVIAATNQDLQEKIAAGEFLPDLYDRLTFETIEVPPLRQRCEDIPVLAQWFLQQFAAEIPGFAGKRLSPAALAALERHPFPGNVRELKNTIERAAYRDTGSLIEPEDLDLPVAEPAQNTRGGFHKRLEAYTRHLIEEALEQAAGNQAEAARSLELPYHQFRYYLRKYPAQGRCRHCGAERSGARRTGA
jgi:DNA-binding NtrC family response regulator